MAHARLKAVNDKYDAPLVGPQMSIGSAPNDSITAFDPAEKKGINANTLTAIRLAPTSRWATPR